MTSRFEFIEIELANNGKSPRESSLDEMDGLWEKAKKSIKNLLNGKSLASVSTFADDIKSDPKYKKFNPWHYVNIKSGENYDTKNKNKNGDVIVAIYKCLSLIHI